MVCFQEQCYLQNASYVSPISTFPITVLSRWENNETHPLEYWYLRFYLFIWTTKPRKPDCACQEQKLSCKSMNWQENSDAVLEACNYLKHWVNFKSQVPMTFLHLWPTEHITTQLCYSPHSTADFNSGKGLLVKLCLPALKTKAFLWVIMVITPGHGNYIMAWKTPNMRPWRVTYTIHAHIVSINYCI